MTSEDQQENDLILNEYNEETQESVTSSSTFFNHSLYDTETVELHSDASETVESSDLAQHSAKEEAKAWTAIFKRKSSTNADFPLEKKAKRDQSYRHICLLCSQELKRGSKSYKERHWARKHKDEKEHFVSSIVPVTHVKAVELLKRKRNQNVVQNTGIKSLSCNEIKDLDNDNTDNIELTCSIASSSITNLDKITLDEEYGPDPKETPNLINPINNSVPHVVPSNDTGSDNLFVSCSSNAQEKQDNGPAEKIQSTVTSFLEVKEIQKTGMQDNAIAKLEDGINQILMRLVAMNIDENHEKVKSKPVTSDELENISDASVKVARNLVELSNCPQIEVEILADGCRVTCIPCHEYIRENPLMRINAASKSWGLGLAYDVSRTEKYTQGANQEWYSFKNRLYEHVCCSSTCNAGNFHMKALQHRLKMKRQNEKYIDVNVKLVAAGIETCKMKAAGLSYESLVAFLSFCGVNVGNIGHGRKQFPDIIKAAYIYVMKQTASYMRKPLENTGLPPHFSVAIDKSTPHRDTNHAVMIFLPVNGKRTAIPIDAPLVYKSRSEEDSSGEESVVLHGGYGVDLAEQVITVLKDSLHLTKDDLDFLRGVHADGQYQASTFQKKLRELLNLHRKLDPYFLLPWDTSHWLDLAIVELREKSPSSTFLHRLIKRSNRLHAMFGSGRGHAEYKEFSKTHKLKAVETVTYATTRFSSSAFESWQKIYTSYPALIKAYAKSRENTGDDCEETKYQVRGQDFAIDLCGVIDILQPAVNLMIKSQALSVPPWKIVVWFPRVIDILEKIKVELNRLKSREVQMPGAKVLPKLAKHWEELTREDIEDCSFQEIEIYDGWLVVSQNNEPDQATSKRSDGIQEKQKKKKTITWEARSPDDCVDDLIQLGEELQTVLTSRYENLEIDGITNLKAIFDIEGLLELLCLCKFSYEDGRMKVSRQGRQLWDLHGREEFANFFKYVCMLPHVMKLLENRTMLKLLPHNSDIVLECFKTTLLKMVWENLGNCASSMFVDRDEKPVKAFEEDQLVSIRLSEFSALDLWFSLTFFSEKSVEARINEEFIYTSMYVNEDVIKSLGQEMSIALDVELSMSDCEAIVEGFYNLVGNHKKNGGQSNDVLVQRSVVDWSIPHPASCPATMRAIAEIYTKGDKSCNSCQLPKHRYPVLSDWRGRASNHTVSKVVDRITHEQPRCPHILKESDCS